MTTRALLFLIVAIFVGLSAWLFAVNKDAEQSDEIPAAAVPIRNEQSKDFKIAQNNNQASAKPFDPTVNSTTSQKPIQNNNPQQTNSNNTGNPNKPTNPANSTNTTNATNTTNTTGTAVSTNSTAQIPNETSQQQLVEERQKLQNLRNNLERLKAQNDQQTVSNTYTQIQQGSLELQNLAMELRNYDNVEREINRRADELIKDQNSQAQVVRDQLETNIRDVEAQMKQSQEQIDYWNLNRNYLTEELARLAEAQNALELQRQQLENLRQQRLELSTRILESERLIRAQKDQEIADLNQDKVNLQSQILNMNQEISRLQIEEDRQRVSRMSLASQIIRAQKDFDEEQNKIRNLESSLNQTKNINQ